MVYQQRLLLFADILGWSEAINNYDGVTLLEAVHKIQRYAEGHNERVRKHLIALEGTIIETDLGPSRVERINLMHLEIQFGAFSDHFVFSMPPSFNVRIFGIAQKLIIELLRAGFSTRGAVVLGKLHHCDNVIFGPALLEAVKIEAGESFYPRILVSKDVVDLCSKLPNDALHKFIIVDQTGRSVVNPFPMPFYGPEKAIESFMELNFCFPEIKAQIDHQISSLVAQGRQKEAEKWRYLATFIGGPVLDAAPELRRFWH